VGVGEWSVVHAVWEGLGKGGVPGVGVVWLIVGLQAGDDVGGFLPDNGFMVWVVPVEITVGRSLG
jgi:hypothetical protein